MSQAHVTDFFSTRKNKNGGNPSKRRKLGGTNEVANVFSVQETNKTPQQTVNNSANVEDTRPENAVLQTMPEAKSSSRTNRSTKKRLPKSLASKNQPLLKDLFHHQSDKDGYRQVMEEVTSAWDEHDGPLLTPSKRSKEQNDSDSEMAQGSKKRSRCGSKKVEIEETPEKCFEDNPRTEVKARKQLILKQVADNVSEDQTPMLNKPETSTCKDIPMSPRLKKTIEKVKLLGSIEKKFTADNVKDKLKKCGRLEEIKAQLSQMSKNLKDLKKTPAESPKLGKFETVTIESPIKEIIKPKEASPLKQKAPAYERFHSLATPAPPTLSLPYKYKLLAEMFRNCDTVVSMLHNRAEVCTFSKLKAAVQDMGKRNFEKKNLGQIKAVDPSVYTLRQEKGFAAFGNKKSGYQLTVEAHLPQENESASVGYKTRQTFTAKHLLERRSVFTNKLISIVKRHHKEFLSNLDKPLNVPDDKITRWHPKFRLDEVADIEPSDLPKPPNVEVYQTAKDVLENARGKVLPNVEKALENVSNTKKETPVVTSDKPKDGQNEMRGVPQTLLEKIRAKEAKKMEAAMMRNPVEDKRQKMLQKLPEMMRILRGHFVMEKKPALLKTEIVTKLVDSCRSAIAVGDVETHLNLMIEVLPQWLKQIEIKKGKYIKMDRNMELQTLIAHVNKSIDS
ncbi:DNA replication factor Cdt1-like [Mytilus galloprovincialis]|uniref:DNA replication factor Cdt1-like n=1 Tax=Mytilus galloprovincialis TaxID=29158 RepID=UPI003F7C8960